MYNRLKIAAFCVLSVVILLTGCEKNNDTPKPVPSENYIETKNHISYTSEKVMTNSPFNGNAIGRNGNIFFIEDTIWGRGNNSYALISMDSSGNEIFSVQLDCNIANENIFFDVDGNIICIVSDNDNIYRMITVDTSGKIISDTDLQSVISKNEYISDWIIDSEGNIIFNVGVGVKIADKNGNLLFTIEMENNEQIYSLIMTGNGIPAAVTADKLYEINLENKKFGEKHKLSYTGEIFSGFGEYLCLTAADSGIYGIRKNDLERERLLGYLQTGIVSPQVYKIYNDTNGNIIITSLESEGKVFYIVTPNESDSANEKKAIKVGGYFSFDNVISKAAEFNRTNAEYYVEFINYNDNYGNDEYTSKLSQLNKDILAGNVPDILIVEPEMSYEKYAEKGLFADLYKFIDDDDELSRKDFLPNLLSVMETDGKLYSVCTDFVFESYIGKKSVLGESGAISVDRAYELLAKLNDGARLTQRPITCDDFVLQATEYGNFIDYKNGKCSFNSPEFIKILEKASEFPKEIDFSQYDLHNSTINGDSLFTGDTISRFYGMYSYADIKASIGEDVSFMGFPTMENGSGAKLALGRRFAVSAQSEVKEAAWEFLKSLLTDSVTYDETDISDSLNQPVEHEMRWVCHTDGFPVLTEQLFRLGEQSLDPEKTVNENGEIIPKDRFISSGDRRVKVEPLTEKESNDLIEFIMSLDNVTIYDKNVRNIITEECSYYFSGVRSAEETAELIQSRISIYVSE